MDDLKPRLERLRDDLTPPDDPYDRLVQRRARKRRRQQIETAALALVMAAAGLAFAARVFFAEPPRSQSPAQVVPVQLPEGWTELPAPPEIRDGAALVWTGSELLAWGGCDAATPNDCVATSTGYALDPSTREWSAMPEAPARAAAPHGVWTGDEAIFLSLGNPTHLDGQAFDPQTRSWRSLPPAPIAPRSGAVYLWTGSEVIVWGGGDLVDPVNTEGAAYDPASDSWRTIDRAPLGLNLASAVWTGREMIAFGSLLDQRNAAETETAVGAAYDPALDRWRELPPSDLSPQATSAVWTGEVMVAWDYEVHSQEYDPATNKWTEPQKMPLDFSECYPDSVQVGGSVFAFFCGQAATFDAGSSEWTAVSGGPLDDEVRSDAYDARIPLWRFALMAPAGDVVFMAMEGITLSDKGEACYGCPGSPQSFWAYRPPGT
ncbi:MAG TPA: hypothetical protein VE962_07635 [Actinomycetota bacterium]|nr:hypothetical protein [Actinomycetota bacterium]